MCPSQSLIVIYLIRLYQTRHPWMSALYFTLRQFLFWILGCLDKYHRHPKGLGRNKWAINIGMQTEPCWDVRQSYLFETSLKCVIMSSFLTTTMNPVVISYRYLQFSDSTKILWKCIIYSSWKDILKMNE